nr:NB-ARC domain-containing protein [Anaerolineae bacterium]
MNIQHDGDSRGENINNMNIYPGGTTRYDPSRSPMMVEPLKSDFVPRPELDQVIGALIRSEQGSVGITSKHALRGAGGYGKTTIAQAVCHNEQIRAKFKDGILWVRLSESPPDARPQLLGLLYLLTGIKLDSTDINAIKTELDQVLQDRSVLLVVDDAWRSEHLTPFLLNCTLLITTRNRETLPRGIEPFTVDAMREGESVKLLGADLEADLAADPSLPDQLKALAKRLGYWPLLLQLVNKTLNKRLKKGGESLAKALNYIDKALKHEGLIAFDDPEDLIQRNRAVEATLKVSFNELNPQERDRFNLLAVFPEDTLIPFPALEKLWGIDDYYVDKFCERLESLSLVRQIDLKTYTILIHDVIRQYLIETMESSQYQQAQQRFLDAYGVSDWRNLPADERYLRDHLALAHHVIEAGQLDKLNAILQNLRYLAKKTHLKGRIAVENDFKAAGKHADEQTRVLGRLYINHAHFFTEKSTEGDILTNLTLRARQVELLKPFTVDLPTLFEAIWDLPDSSDPALVRRVVAGHTKTVTAG